MRAPRLRVTASSSNAIFMSWCQQPSVSASDSSSSLLKNKQSRCSPSFENNGSETSLGFTDTKSGTLKSIRTPIDSIEGTLEGPFEMVSQTKESYTLQTKHSLLGWTTIYWGFHNQLEVSPLAPGEVYQFRVKVTIEKEDSEWSEELIAATKDDVISAGNLHRALEQGHMTSARKVLALRISALEIPNRLGQTPLAMATYRGDTGICNMLLTCGADVTAQEMGSLRTPLMAAAFRGDIELIQNLKEKDASWSSRDRFGQTALHYAILKEVLPVVQLAIKEAPDINARDNYGWTPLMLAVVSNLPKKIVECLLKSGADVNSYDERGQTILMQAIISAVISGSIEIIELLLKYGADVSAINNNGHSAYDIALHHNVTGLKELLSLMECSHKTSNDHLPKRRKQSQSNLFETDFIANFVKETNYKP